MEEGLPLSHSQAEADRLSADPNLEELWEHYKTHKDFFASIELAKDGGMSEASELITTVRYITGILPIAFVCFNAYSIYTTNLGYVFGTLGGDTDGVRYYLVIRQICEALGVTVPENALTIIAFLEIAIMTVYLGRCLWWLFLISWPNCGAGNDPELTRWTAVQEFFWQALPEASTISTVKLLNYVTPAVFFPAFSARVIPTCRICSLVFFLLSRAVMGIIGFDALLFKLQVNQADIQAYYDCNCQGQDCDGVTCNGDPGVWGILINCLVFMTQITGIVQIGWFVKRRIFAFIFAGEDGVMSLEEEAIKETWETMLAQRIWQCEGYKWYQCLAIYLTWSDYDFQRLALETVDDDKEKKEKKSKREIEMADREEPAEAS